ncbi:hypothetical protein TKK_0017074 [Trichogramma kaykai]
MTSNLERTNSESVFMPQADISLDYITHATDQECRALFGAKYPQLIGLWDEMDQRKSVGVTSDTGSGDFNSV